MKGKRGEKREAESKESTTERGIERKRHEKKGQKKEQSSKSTHTQRPSFRKTGLRARARAKRAG